MENEEETRTYDRELYEAAVDRLTDALFSYEWNQHGVLVYDDFHEFVDEGATFEEFEEELGRYLRWWCHAIGVNEAEVGYFAVLTREQLCPVDPGSSLEKLIVPGWRILLSVPPGQHVSSTGEALWYFSGGHATIQPFTQESRRDLKRYFFNPICDGYPVSSRLENVQCHGSAELLSTMLGPRQDWYIPSRTVTESSNETWTYYDEHLECDKEI